MKHQRSCGAGHARGRRLRSEEEKVRAGRSREDDEDAYERRQAISHLIFHLKAAWA
ncbi:MAG: hypothetical protein V3T61_08275 [Acidobacteriota bacterium]